MACYYEFINELCFYLLAFLCISTKYHRKKSREHVHQNRTVSKIQIHIQLLRNQYVNKVYPSVIAIIFANSTKQSTLLKTFGFTAFGFLDTL
jgi:hypothetical protein